MSSTFEELKGHEMSDEMQLLTLTKLSEALDMSKGSLEPSNAELLDQIAGS